MHFLRVLVVVLFLAGAGVSSFFYWQYRQAVQANPETELASVTEYLGKFMVLPSGQATPGP